MRMSVIGCGYLGAVHAAAMASIGHHVVGIDVDEKKVTALASSTAPFFEPRLAELLEAGLRSGRLRFSTDISEAAGSDIHFLAVGTPQVSGGHAADLRFVDAAMTPSSCGRAGRCTTRSLPTGSSSVSPPEMRANEQPRCCARRTVPRSRRAHRSS